MMKVVSLSCSWVVWNEVEKAGLQSQGWSCSEGNKKGRERRRKRKNRRRNGRGRGRRR